jgi:hypothetical protein
MIVPYGDTSQGAWGAPNALDGRFACAAAGIAFVPVPAMYPCMVSG